MGDRSVKLVDWDDSWNPLKFLLVVVRCGNADDLDLAASLCNLLERQVQKLIKVRGHQIWNIPVLGKPGNISIVWRNGSIVVDQELKLIQVSDEPLFLREEVAPDEFAGNCLSGSNTVLDSKLLFQRVQLGLIVMVDALAKVHIQQVSSDAPRVWQLLFGGEERALSGAGSEKETALLITDGPC